MADNQNDEWESTKGSGNSWNPTKDEDGDPRTEATPEDYLDGYYVDKKENVGQYNATVYTLQKEDGEKVDVWGTTALNGEMDKVRMGSFIRIKWLGKLPTKAGALIPEKKRKSTDSFHSWEVLVNKKKEPIGGAKLATEKVPSNAGTGSGKSGESKKEEEDDLPF